MGAAVAVPRFMAGTAAMLMRVVRALGGRMSFALPPARAGARQLRPHRLQGDVADIEFAAQYGTRFFQHARPLFMPADQQVGGQGAALRTHLPDVQVVHRGHAMDGGEAAPLPSAR